MRLVDAHCHFDFPFFQDNRPGAWERARKQGVEQLVIPGVRQADWERVIRVAAESERWWYCLGIHPWFVDEHDEASLDELEGRLKQANPGCLALGECGLDRLHGELGQQMPWFEAQVDMAARLAMPLVIHSVRTHDEVAAVLRRKRPDIPVLVHGFSGSYEQGRALVDLGCFLETDAPDMSPAGVAKGENEPANLRQVLTSLAELLGIDEERLAAVLKRNTDRLYRWSVD